MFPGSGLAKKPPDWLVAAELVETSRLWGRTVAAIEPEWVEPVAAHLVKRTYSEPRWSRTRGAAIATPVTLVAMSAVVLPAAAQAQTTARAAAPATVQPPLTKAQAAAFSTNVTDKVIVVFKNQFTNVADTPSNTTVRAADVQSTQSAVMTQLGQTHALNDADIDLAGQHLGALVLQQLLELVHEHDQIERI